MGSANVYSQQRPAEAKGGNHLCERQLELNHKKKLKLILPCANTWQWENVLPSPLFH